jgi:hypothetical protein
MRGLGGGHDPDTHNRDRRNDSYNRRKIHDDSLEPADFTVSLKVKSCLGERKPPKDPKGISGLIARTLIALGLPGANLYGH